ncbi:MAG: DUF4298 domain-containing protein [Clostridia bacterium]|nr:DUF4298 domain-containing protein [Clostridia bacterium]
MQRIDRIKCMEEKFDKALKAVEELDAALENFEAVIPEIEELIAYYELNLWRRDFAADEAGKLPSDLKRGVLSEDGIYNLLSDYQRLKELL